MKFKCKFFALSTVVFLALGWSGLNALAQQEDPGGEFRLHSTLLENGGTMPLSTILNYTSDGVNACTASGVAGGDQSPDLEWSGVPEGTKSFVVVLYDVTAAFTHWGIYNIRGDARSLPANAGVAASIYGTEIENDFAYGQEYDGPCPPSSLEPTTHEYVFTIYALSTKLELPGSTNFPANGQTLYHALIKAGEKGQILGQAKLAGFYSTATTE